MRRQAEQVQVKPPKEVQKKKNISKVSGETQQTADVEKTQVSLWENQVKITARKDTKRVKKLITIFRFRFL